MKALRKNWLLVLVAVGAMAVALIVAPTSRADETSFLGELYGYVPIKDEAAAVEVGYMICNAMNRNPQYSSDQVTDAIWYAGDVSAVMTHNQLNIVVLASVVELCPWNAGNGPSTPFTVRRV